MTSLGLLLVDAETCPAGSLTQGEAVAAAAKDVLGIPVKDRRFQRYLWVPIDGDELAEFDLVTRLHVNLLNPKETEFYFPRQVLPQLWRIDLREQHWPADVWERLLKVDRYFRVPVPLYEDKALVTYWPGGRDADGKSYDRGAYETLHKRGSVVRLQPPTVKEADFQIIRANCYTEVPVVNAEWLFVQTCRQISLRNEEEGTGYYDFLGLKSRDDYFALLGLDVKQALVKIKEMRAVVDKSGVSEQNRVVFMLPGISGPVWGTLDTKNQSGRGVAKRNLLPGEFEHQAEEYYGTLPNGLWVTYLSDQDGKQQATAPDFIGPDDSPLRVGRDARVHSNLSCMRCHGVKKDMLKPVDDWVRRTFKSRWNPTSSKTFQSKDKETYLRFRRLYETDLPRALERNRQDYVNRLALVTATPDNPAGWDSVTATNAYGNAYNRYVEKGVSVYKACLELGVSREDYLGALKKYAEVLNEQESVLADHLEDPNALIPRLDWEDAFPDAQFIAHGLVPPIYAVSKKR